MCANTHNTHCTHMPHMHMPHIDHVHASCGSFTHTRFIWTQLHFPFSHRTPGTGLYDNLQKYSLPDPTAVFDTSYFAHNPRPFFSLAKELYPGRYSPNLAHCFVALLQNKGVLLRNYTQNIDGLERCEWDGKSVHVHVHEHVSSHVHACLYIPTHVHACLYVHMYIVHVHTCTHIHVYYDKMHGHQFSQSA